MPAHVAEAMVRFWEEFHVLEPTSELGGYYAPKPGYHNYRDALPASDYSVRLPQDKVGRGDLCAAIDLTFPDAQSARYATIIKYARRLLASGLDPDDPRGNRLREFYGQADSDNGVEGWDFQLQVSVTSDLTHLWHIHISVLRQYVEDWETFRALLSILRGETVAQWVTGGDAVYIVNVVDGSKNYQYATDGLGRSIYLSVEGLSWWRSHGAVDVGAMTVTQAKAILNLSVTPTPVPGTPIIEYDKLARALLAELLKS